MGGKLGTETRRLGALSASLAVALLAICAFAASASARTFVVNVPGDESEIESCQGTSPCTLRDAIERANETTGADTIEFGIDGVIAIEGFPLPRIEEAVTIDGTTAPGYSGAPVVEIDGAEAFNEGPVDGLEIYAGPSTVRGLAIGNFSTTAIVVESAGPVHLCGDHLGVDMTGSQARPDFIGVEVRNGSAGTQIGAGCPVGQGNLISGNEYFGILDSGQGTEIAANGIGLDAQGGALGNGGYEEQGGPPEGGGVFATEAARGTYIGPVAGEAGNTIAFDEIAGVRVSALAEQVTIGQNSIHSNVGPGIEYEGGPVPAVPSLATAEGKPAETTVGGSLEAEAEESFFVEFFANQACDEGGSGEGQTPLGGLSLTTDATGKVSFKAHGLDALPAGQTVLTATATAELGSTSEFSKCLTATVIPPEVKPPPGDLVLPVNGESVALETVSGTILIELPGEKKFHRLGKGEIIPVGTIVDATNGKVTLTSIDDEGHEQSAIFYGGKFQVFQQPGSGLVVLRLRGDGVGACGGSSGIGAAGRVSIATASKRRGRHLWGSGHGNFRTEGSHGSATVQGTIWFTEDRCDGTFFKTKRGVVTIRDFTQHKTLKLPKGQTYLAAAP